VESVGDEYVAMGRETAGSGHRPWQNRHMPVHHVAARCRRFGAIAAALGATLVLCSGHVACGGLETVNQGKDSSVVDSTSGDVEVDADGGAPSDPCILSPGNYDVSCHVDTDCVAVWFGNVCSAAMCAGCEPNGAINVSSTDAYSRNISAVVDTSVACPCPPPQWMACCDRGTCAFQSHCGG
jgi:hypothetical protein